MGANKSKYRTLRSAAKMTTTTAGHPINKAVKLRFFTNAQIKQIKEDKKTSPDIKNLLSPNYCEFTKINQNLYMTGVGGLTKENMKINRIKWLINVTYEAPRYWVRGVQTFRIPVEDTDPNIAIYFNEVSELVMELTKNQKNIVIVCTTGVCRSATIVLAILMKAFQMTLIDAYNYLKSLRQVIRPSDQYWEQLIFYENKLFGENTVNMAEVCDQFGNLLKVPDVYL